MTILVDTNLLFYGAQPGQAMYPPAVTAVERLLGSDESLILAPQNLYEYWAVATRPAASNGLGFTTARTHAELQRLKRLFSTFPDVPAIFGEWERLVNRYEAKGKVAHDARLVAWMNVHATNHLLTFNGRDFARYESITVLDPYLIAK